MTYSFEWENPCSVKIKNKKYTKKIKKDDRIEQMTSEVRMKLERYNNMGASWMKSKEGQDFGTGITVICNFFFENINIK